MTPEDFIRALKSVVHDSAIRGMRQTLDRPTGRKPQKSIVELSDWYHSLTDLDRSKLMKVVQYSVHASIFNFLCVLDGVAVFEDLKTKAKLELFYVRNGLRTRLNDPDAEFLHDLYQAEVYEDVFKG